MKILLNLLSSGKYLSINEYMSNFCLVSYLQAVVFEDFAHFFFNVSTCLGIFVQVASLHHL